MAAIEIIGLDKKYRSGPHALRSVDLTIRGGDFFALLGPNGAGKSTLIGILTSLIIKTSGRVTINGYNLDLQKSQAKSCLGLVPQEFNLNFFEKSQSILINQAGYYGVSKKVATYRSEKYLKLLKLWDYRNQITRNLSGGMKRRLMIARSLVHEPPILILDEPTAGVDVELRKFIWAFLQDLNSNKKKTIILTTHYLEEVEKLCRNVAIIHKGKIVSNGTLQDLVSQLPGQRYILSLSPFDMSLESKLESAPFKINILDSMTLEATINNSHSINDLFKYLDTYQIKVRSVRTKENPIESAFFHVTSKV